MIGWWTTDSGCFDDGWKRFQLDKRERLISFCNNAEVWTEPNLRNHMQRESLSIFTAWRHFGQASLTWRHQRFHCCARRHEGDKHLHRKAFTLTGDHATVRPWWSSLRSSTCRSLLVTWSQRGSDHEEPERISSIPLYFDGWFVLWILRWKRLRFQ